MGRKQIVKNLMCKQANDLTEEEIDEISEITDGLPLKFFIISAENFKDFI